MSEHTSRPCLPLVSPCLSVAAWGGDRARRQTKPAAQQRTARLTFLVGGWRFLLGSWIAACVWSCCVPAFSWQTSGDFDWNLYRSISRESGNVCCSPSSIAIAMSMVSAGASGETWEELRTALGIEESEVEYWKQQAAALQELNQQGKGWQLRCANRLWGQDSLPFQPEFVRTLNDNYKAPLGLWDFQRDPEGARQAINEWVAGQTKNKIPELFAAGSLDNDTRLVLANAIYFLSDWRSPFKASATKSDKFFLVDGTTASASFMRQTLEIPYGENSAGQWISLPYAADHLSMWIILPAAGTTLETWSAEMTKEKWETLCSEATSRDVQLSLPKFQFDSSYVLNKALQQLGIRRAFEPTAEFQRMTSADSLHISLVVHKAFIDVSERGTEAAAATGVAMATAMAPMEPRPPVVFTANRPFLFVIRDNLRNQNLFIGRLVQPK